MAYVSRSIKMNYYLPRPSILILVKNAKELQETPDADMTRNIEDFKSDDELLKSIESLVSQRSEQVISK